MKKLLICLSVFSILAINFMVWSCGDVTNEGIDVTNNGTDDGTDDGIDDDTDKSGAILESYSIIGCLGFTRKAQAVVPGEVEDEIIAEVKGNDIYVTHKNVEYNCCPQEIRVELEQDGNVIKLIET